MKTRYTVETLRAGQPRPYADSEYEYLITCEHVSLKEPDVFTPWTMFGDVERRITQEEAARKAGNMMGGNTPDGLRKQQRDWAKSIVTALCRKFREPKDEDGRTGMEAAFYPTLKKLSIDHQKGTIRAFIVEAYTD